MFYESHSVWRQSIIISFFILIVGIVYLGSITANREISVATITLYYYNSSDAVEEEEGQIACDTDAISSITRVTSFAATSTNSMTRLVLNELLYKPLNPIEENNGFTRVNIPDAIVVENVSSQASTTLVSVLIGESERLNECEETLLTHQIERTMAELKDISQASVSISYE